MIDAIIRFFVGPIATRWYRWSIRDRENSNVEWIRVWHKDNPGKCMYCSYTNWANREKGQSLKIGPHACIENNGGPKDGLPKAHIIKE